MIHGTITRVFLPRGFAFVRGDDGLDYFFNADEFYIGDMRAPSEAWDGAVIREHARVRFLPRSDGRGGNGLRACGVRLC